MKILTHEKINLLRQNARSVVRELGLLNDAYFDIGVSLAERHLLIELNSLLYPTVGEIAQRLLLDKSTASRLIAKAFKKKYVQYSTDENDKRKRFLQLTENGRRILDAFEPIAFNQTKEALLTLSAEEIDIVYKGIELYAKGLKNSRLRNKVVITQISPHDNPGIAHLGTIHNHDIEWANLFETYQKKRSVYFVMKIDSKIIGGAGISPDHSTATKSCRLEKTCLQADIQGLGFEKILIDFTVKEAKKLGYDKCFVDTAEETVFTDKFFHEQGFQILKNNKQMTLRLWKAC